MQFANQAISFFVSGLLCMLWMFLPVFGMNESLHKTIQDHINSNGFAALGLFFIFPFSYALGNAINSLANLAFSKRDQKIRNDVLDNIKKISENQIIEKDIKKINKFIQIKNNEIFNFYRFQSYTSETKLYDFLTFHREIIRILRALSLNSFMIFLAFFTIVDCFLIKCLGLILMAAYIIILVLPHISIDEKDKTKFLPGLYKKMINKNPLNFISIKIVALNITIFLFIIMPLIIMPISTKIFSLNHPELYYIGVLFLFISSLSSIAWEKQQEDFYLTMIRAHFTEIISNK